jgi:tetratricopeptide (TPR) repeat protein
MPLAGRIILGAWSFQEAAAISVICFAIAAYLHLRSRGRMPVIPDSAAMMDRAFQLSASGSWAKAISLLTKTLRLDTKRWQAFQYRAELRTSQGDYRGALDDISEAIRLAPRERHLYLLRARVYSAMGEAATAQQDYETASRLGDS